jgi:hypothetical protein
MAKSAETANPLAVETNGKKLTFYDQADQGRSRGANSYVRAKLPFSTNALPG